MMTYHWQLRPYRRIFTPPLQTHHGLWTTREGLIVRLSDHTGQTGFGEIAPLSDFGSETLAQAWHFCQQLPCPMTSETIASIPDELPACQFGFASAWESLHACGTSQQQRSPLPCCGLLPTGSAALETWQNLWHQGYRTFKWKIGVAPLQVEAKILEALVRSFPSTVKLRLDANGGLDWHSAQQWLQICDRIGIEFLEQPLGTDQFEAMLELSQHYTTPLALDESVATLRQLQTCYQRGWRGIFVIKPAIAGSPAQLRQFCQTHALDTVFSSVFETAVGRRVGLALAQELMPQQRAIGFGISHWFSDDLDQGTELDFEQLWQQL